MAYFRFYWIFYWGGAAAFPDLSSVNSFTPNVCELCQWQEKRKERKYVMREVMAMQVGPIIKNYMEDHGTSLLVSPRPRPASGKSLAKADFRSLSFRYHLPVGKPFHEAYG